MHTSKNESNSPFSSLSYQILLVFGWWYFLVFISAETLLLIFKKYYYLYPIGNFLSEFFLLFILTGIESIRIFIGKKGNLTERPFSIILSLLLTVPVTSGVLYFFWWQTYVLMLDFIISIVLFVFLGMQSLFAAFTLISFGR